MSRFCIENPAEGGGSPKKRGGVQGGRKGVWRGFGGGGWYMREIGAMWQIGVLTGKLCTFLVQNGSFSAFWHYKNKERLSRGLDVKWLMMPSKSGFPLEFIV